MKTINKNLKKYEEKLKESALFDSEALVEADNSTNEDGLTDEELKEVALDIAIDISRLMEKVSPDDILKISRDVANYIKFHVIGSEYDPDKDVMSDDEEVEKPVDIDDDKDYDIIDDEFTIDDEDDEEDNDEKDEKEEKEDASEKTGVIPDEFII